MDGFSRRGASPAAVSSGHAMVWSWYGWPLEFGGSCAARRGHDRHGAGWEAAARRVTADTAPGDASPQAVVTSAFFPLQR